MISYPCVVALSDLREHFIFILESRLEQPLTEYLLQLQDNDLLCLILVDILAVKQMESSKLVRCLSPVVIPDDSIVGLQLDDLIGSLLVWFLC